MSAGRRIPFALCLVPAAALAGCTHVNPDYRYREGHTEQLREQLYSGEFAASARHREDPGRPQTAHVAAYSAPPPPAGRLTLSAAPHGERGQALRVLVGPRDPGGRPVRAGTALRVSVLQDTPGGQSACLSDWELPADLLEHAWAAGWSEAGYRLIVPWKIWPTADRVRVVARLTREDGSHQEAQADVVLRPAAPAADRTGELRQAHASAVDNSGVQSADVRGEASSLQGAVRIRRPEPLQPLDDLLVRP